VNWSRFLHCRVGRGSCTVYTTPAATQRVRAAWNTFAKETGEPADTEDEMQYAMPSTPSSPSTGSRLHRLLTLINAIKTNPRQTPEALWKSLGIGKTMFYQQ
jgi:hypothetical protein